MSAYLTLCCRPIVRYVIHAMLLQVSSFEPRVECWNPPHSGPSLSVSSLADPPTPTDDGEGKPGPSFPGAASRSHRAVYTTVLSLRLRLPLPLGHAIPCRPAGDTTFTYYLHMLSLLSSPHVMNASVIRASAPARPYTPHGLAHTVTACTTCACPALTYPERSYTVPTPLSCAPRDA